jgi:hypothetical protein
MFTINSSGAVNMSSSAYAGGTNYIRIYQGSGDASYSFEISKTLNSSNGITINGFNANSLYMA